MAAGSSYPIDILNAEQTKVEVSGVVSFTDSTNQPQSALNTIASCTIAISPDNVTFTTLATPSLAAAVNNTGAITLATNVPLPQGWYIKLTFSNFTVAASKYY